jgi:LmbE family N-acetylglucosaminyl deacetylase
VRFPPLACVGLLLSTAAVGVRADDGHAPLPLTLGPDRALVVSPHPDDAALGAGGLIQRVLHAGGTIRAVEMTGGDAFPQGVKAEKPGTQPTPDSYRWYGTLREHEAISAMRRLGVHRSGVRLLGFPDEGMCVVASAKDAGEPFTSPYTKRESPPPADQVVPGTMYRRDDLLRELTRLIAEFQPTLVVLPHAADEHPDHCATHLLMHEALAHAVAAGVHPPRVLHYVVHYPHWPAPEGADAEIRPPSDARADTWTWLTLALTPEERKQKRLALETYRSQMLVMADFLRGFERPNELFIEGEPASPIPCWCAGTNITAASLVR